MEDSARLKLIVLGLVLAAIAGAYLFFSGRFASKTNKVVQNPTPTATPTSVGSANGQPIIIPGNAPIRSDVPQGANTQPLPQTGVSSLPNTGLPLDLIGTIGAAAVVVGYAFRKYPK